MKRRTSSAERESLQEMMKDTVMFFGNALPVENVGDDVRFSRNKMKNAAVSRNVMPEADM